MRNFEYEGRGANSTCEIRNDPLPDCYWMNPLGKAFIVMPRSLIFMSTHKATAARCLRSTAVRVTTLRRLALSVLFIIRSTRLLATRPLVPSPREPSIKGNTPMLDTELSLTHTPKHYDMVAARTQP